MTRPADTPDSARHGAPDGPPDHAPASGPARGPGARPAAPSGARTGAPSAVRPAPWVRTRLRTAPSSALLAAALAFVAVLLAASLPRAVDRGADQALRSFLHDRGPVATSLLATSTARYGDQSTENLDSVRNALLARTGAGFAIAPSGVVHGTQASKQRDLANPGLPSPDGVPPRMDLLYLRDAAAHTELVEGRWPSGGAPDAPVPIALSRQAAQTLGVRVGTVLESFPSNSEPMSAEIVGLYRATDEDDVFWAGLPCLTRACQANTPSVPPQRYWQTAALVGPDRLDRLALWGGGAEDFWRLPVDTGRLRADLLPDVAREIASYVGGPTASALRGSTRRSDLRITSRLPELFKQAEARQQAVAPLAAIGPAGVAGVAAVVFCLAAALTGDRRESELRLLLARGGSPRGIVGRLLGEGAVTVLPAAALATALALWLLPTPRGTASLLAAAAVTLLALLAFPVRAAVLLSARRRGPAPRRRLVAELLAVAATAAAVFEVRSRGVAPAGEGLDPLLVAAPLLLALCGGLALARLQPVLVGVLARAAGRRPGLIGFLGLARAARGTGGRARPSVLPLIALLLAVTTGGFGATVLDAVDTGRLRVARLAVGGDVQISAPYGSTLPPAMTEAAAALPGVRTSVGVWTDDKAFVFGTVQGSTQVTVVVADPVAYAELAGTIGRGRFDPALLAKDPGAGAPLPALFSSDLAKLAEAGTYRLSFGDGGELQIGSVGVVEGTPVRPGTGGAVVVLPAGPTTARLPKTGHPDRWLATGAVDGDRLREAVRATAPAETAARFTVRTSADTAAELGSDPLQQSAGRLFWASVAGAAGFALLAVLLTLVRAAPERAALLARLRTMGLRPRDGIRLILTEALPQALAATLGGALVAAAAVALLGPAMDLSALVGSTVPTGLSLTAPPLLTQALGLAFLVTVAVLAEAAISGRRQITTELRAGDQR
ncbi:FtsX-like permease family protein [Streptomyces sp. NPDC051704]|uniref:FtsX-like permease family protein n=1 Tax=Streptomyces sp. NPDC051704 TaxID=3365671 RepID=UPI0037ABC066